MIAVIDYNAGNLFSLCNALTQLKQDYYIATIPQELTRASKIILPGVGAAQSAMETLNKRGFTKAIIKWKKPFLGICLGMQLLSDSSEEGDVPCLGIISGRVKKIPSMSTLKVPQMGWNSVALLKASPLLDAVPLQNNFYFTHSYYFDAPSKYRIGQTQYGISLPSIVHKKNFFGVQFHPEKSGAMGLTLLSNFCTLC